MESKEKYTSPFRGGNYLFKRKTNRQSLQGILNVMNTRSINPLDDQFTLAYCKMLELINFEISFNTYEELMDELIKAYKVTGFDIDYSDTNDILITKEIDTPYWTEEIKEICYADLQYIPNYIRPIVKNWIIELGIMGYYSSFNYMFIEMMEEYMMNFEHGFEKRKLSSFRKEFIRTKKKVRKIKASFNPDWREIEIDYKNGKDMLLCGVLKDTPIEFPLVHNYNDGGNGEIHVGDLFIVTLSDLKPNTDQKIFHNYIDSEVFNGAENSMYNFGVMLVKEIFEFNKDIELVANTGNGLEELEKYYNAFKTFYDYVREFK